MWVYWYFCMGLNFEYRVLLLFCFCVIGLLWVDLRIF